MTDDEVPNEQQNFIIYSMYVANCMLRMKKFDNVIVDNKKEILESKNIERIMFMARELNTLITDLSTYQNTMRELIALKSDAE